MRLRAACERVERDAAVRAVVMRGAGPAFLAGGDVALFHANLPRMAELVREVRRRAAPRDPRAAAGAEAGPGERARSGRRGRREPAWRRPTSRIAAADATFTLAYSRIGASPDGGATHFLPRLVGSRKALELMLLSDPIDAQTALALGLVNRVVPAAERWRPKPRAIAQRLAQRRDTARSRRRSGS